MLKRALLFFAAVTLAATSAFAADFPSPLPMDELGTACPAPAVALPDTDQPMDMAIGGPIAPTTCTATANCGSYTISCSYTGPGGTCAFQDTNCYVPQEGFVQCTGQPIEHCEPGCNCYPGDHRTVKGDCCTSTSTAKTRYYSQTCTSQGQWITQNSYCVVEECDPFGP